MIESTSPPTNVRTPSQTRKPKTSSRPFVFVNMGMTADGKIATANRAVNTFGTERDHDHLLELRATADAVMSGARTVNSGPITLGPGPARFRRARLRRGLAEYNLRIVVSGSGSINPDAQIFKERFSPVIILTTERISTGKLARLRELADEVRVCGKAEINWPATLRWLRKKWDVRRLLCEGGSELNSALFRKGLVDELHLTICPVIVGGRTAPTIADGVAAPRLKDARQFQLHRQKRVGDEMFLTFRRSE